MPIPVDLAEVKRLRDNITELKHQNEQLKRENEALRSALKSVSDKIRLTKTPLDEELKRLEDIRQHIERELSYTYRR